MAAKGVVKFWFIVSTFSLLQLQTSVQSTPDPLLSVQDDSDQQYNRYVMFNLLEQAFLKNKFNIYQLQTTFCSENLVLCFPVVYEIECDPDLNDTWHINCTSGYNITFLWTYFDTRNYAGRFLLHFTKNHLKSPLFGIQHKLCEFSPDEFSIKLFFNVSYFPESEMRGNYTVESLISYTLCNITKKLKDYAYAYRHGSCNEQHTLGGYSLLWNKTKENQFESDTRKSGNSIPAVLFLTAFFVGIGGWFEALKIVNENSNDQYSHYYKFFWSFQFLAVLLNGVHTWYIHHTLDIVITIPVVAFIVCFPIVAYYHYYCKKEVPFTKSKYFKFSEFKSTKFFGVLIVTVFAFWNPFVLFVYMAYNLPWIILGFYLYPIKILVRISAILTASICIIGIFFLILLYLGECFENLSKILKQKPQREAASPDELKALTGDAAPTERDAALTVEDAVPTEGDAAPTVGDAALTEGDAAPTEGNEQSPTNDGTVKIVCNVILAVIKFLSGVLVLVCFGFIAYLLHHIIFVFTNDEEETVIELLHILPLIIVTLSSYIIWNLKQLNAAKTERENRTQPEDDSEAVSRGQRSIDSVDRNSPSMQ